MGAYQTTPQFLEDEEGEEEETEDELSLLDVEDEDSNEDDSSSEDDKEARQSFSDDEETPQLDYVFYKARIELQKGQTMTGIVQQRISVDLTSDGEKIGLKTSEIDVEVPVAPGITEVRQFSESDDDDEPEPEKQRIVNFSMVQPVIEDKCAYSGCHGAGDISPDLSTSGRIYNGTYNGEDVTEAIYQAVIVKESMPFSGELTDSETLFEDRKKRARVAHSSQ